MIELTLPTQKWLLSLFIVLINLLFAFIVIYSPLNAINSDGVLYLQTAQTYLKDGWEMATRLYPWPFYSVLIAWVSQLCHCSLEQTAYFLNIFFQILISLGFFNLACIIKGTHESRFMLFAALTILLYPTLNQHRDLIVRDFGYWAFSLWGWFYLIKLSETARTLEGIKFSINMLIASLFRLEGIIMLLFGPLALLGLRKRPLFDRVVLFSKAYGIVLIGLIATSIYMEIHPTTLHPGRLIELETQLRSGITLIAQGIMQAKVNLANHVLTQMSVDSALGLLVGGLIVVYINTLVSTSTPFYSLLAGVCAWKKQFLPIELAKPTLWTAISLNVLITMTFLTQSLFLTERYIFELCLLLLLWTPFSLLWIERQTKRWIFLCVLSMMIIIGAISLHNFGPSKSYLKQAGQWIQANVPPTAKVYINNPQVSFYANRMLLAHENNTPTSIQALFKGTSEKNYAYLAFQVKAGDALLKSQLNQLPFKPVKTFSNEKKDAVWVFCVRNCHP